MNSIGVILCVTLCFGFAVSDGKFPSLRRRRVVMCYWGSWANSRPGIGRFGVDDIPTDLCTHLIYSFIGLDSNGTLTISNPTTKEGKSNNLTELVQLKEKNRKLKVMTAIGGWGLGSESFSNVVNDDALRANFAKNILKYLVDYNLDGIDVDWEYPAQRGGLKSDKEAFIYLLRDLKELLKPRGLLITSAVGVTSAIVETSYHVANMSDILDYINLMTYDLHGYPYNETGINGPLFAQLTDDEDSELNAAALVELWIEQGADPAKLVLGIPSYGRSFTLANLDQVTTGVPASGPGTPGNYTQEAGFWAYYEICLSQQESGWNIVEVEGNYVYAYKDDFWIGYDNENTVKAKVEYAKSMGLGGVMFWAIDLDDFTGVCDSAKKFPLIRTAAEAYGHCSKA